MAQEIGIDKSAETIKAQCVIARTNLYDAMQAGTKETGEHAAGSAAGGALGRKF